MQFKSFMEALKGKQHKIDKNKNGEIDAHDFKLLRKEESEESTETIEEAEQRMARADYKVGPSGRKSHKEIVFNDAESKDEKEEMKEGVQKVDIPAYLRKQQGQAPLKLSDLKRKDTISDKENLAKLRGVKEESENIDEAKPGLYANIHAKRKRIEAGSGERMRKAGSEGAPSANDFKDAAKTANEEFEQIDEKSEQAKRNKIMKNVMSASKGAQINRGLKLDPTEYGYKRAQHLNVAIGRAAMKAEEVKKDDVPFDGPYTKTKPVKNSDGTTQQPMSRARQLAKDAMKKQMKEDIDRLFEKDEKEYGYEGDMAMNQLSTLIRCAEMIKDVLKPDTDLPEWVQSKITLASDYIVTAADYLHSELEEQAPVAPVPDKKYIKGTPEHKAYKATKKPINGMPTNVKSEELKGDQHKIDKNKNGKIDAHDFKLLRKESFDADGNIINSKVSYKDFAMMLEYESKDGVYRNKGSYGGNYVDPEGSDDADDKKPKQQPADKRGRGRPAGAKSGARKITGTSKLFK